MQLVLAFVEQYDFHSGLLNIELVDKELLSKFGYPKHIDASVSDENGVGTISLDYTDITGSMRECDAEFKRSDDFDLEIVNNLLKKMVLMFVKNILMDAVFVRGIMYFLM